MPAVRSVAVEAVIAASKGGQIRNRFGFASLWRWIEGWVYGLR